MAGYSLNGVALFVKRKTFCPEGDTLVQLHVIADNACGADDHAGAVIYGEVMPDSGSRMDVDAGLGMCHFRDDARNKRYSKFKKFMGDTVIAQCFNDGITADDFAIGLCSRITVVSGLDVRGKDASESGQPADETGGKMARFLLVGTVRCRFLTVGGETQSGLNLLAEQAEQPFDIYTDMICNRVGIDCRLSIKSGEKDSTAEFYDFMQNFSGRNRISVFVLMKQAL